MARPDRRTGRTSGESTQFVSAQVDPEQLRALKRAIQDAGKEARRSVRTRLKEAGVVIQKEIQGRTPVHGARSYGKGKRARSSIGKSGGTSYRQRHAPGLLKKSTRLNIGSLRVAIYNNAKAKSRAYPGGYRYGKRLEFDEAMNTPAFFYPGFEAKKGEAMALFNKVLDDAARAYMKG